MSKSLEVIAFSNWSRDFNFFHRMIQWQSLEIWSTLRTKVSGVNVTTKTGYLVNTCWVVLSVLLIWYTFTVCTSRAARASRISSFGTFGGIPFSTSRFWRVSGSGYV